MKALKILTLPIFLFVALLLSGTNLQAQGGTEITIDPGVASPWFTFEIHEVDCGLSFTGAQAAGPQFPGTGVYYPPVFAPTDPSYIITVFNNMGMAVSVAPPGNPFSLPSIDFLPTGETVEFNGFYPCSHPSVIVIY